ncbi:MAG: hypothetical protein AAGF59_01730 [Pseudomonadota bacterium]
MIALQGDNISPTDHYVLEERPEGHWVVYHSERGNRSQVARFEKPKDAINYFFWSMTRTETPWTYREVWEKETGQEM